MKCGRSEAAWAENRNAVKGRVATKLIATVQSVPGVVDMQESDDAVGAVR